MIFIFSISLFPVPLFFEARAIKKMIRRMIVGMFANKPTNKTPARMVERPPVIPMSVNNVMISAMPKDTIGRIKP